MKENLYVVKIINAGDAPDQFWFKRKGGSLVIVREHKNLFDMYITHNPINKEESYGLIPKKHVMVVTKFEYDESKEVE